MFPASYSKFKEAKKASIINIASLATKMGGINFAACY